MSGLARAPGTRMMKLGMIGKSTARTARRAVCGLAAVVMLPAPASSDCGIVPLLAARTILEAPIRPSAAPAPAIPFGGWTQLRYTTSKLLIFTGDVTMSLATTAETVSVRSESRARLLGSTLVDSWSVSTMDRKSGRPQQFLEVRPGHKAECWSFNGTSIVHETMKPHKNVPNEPLEKWRLARTETLPGPAADPEGAPVDPSRWVHDYISMIVRLRDLPLHRTGDTTTVMVSTSRGAAAMRIRVGEERTTKRTLTDLDTGKSRTVSMSELRLRVSPLEGSTAETRGFMNMEGETELWIEATTGTLVEISGNVPKVPGRVVIALDGYRASRSG